MKHFLSLFLCTALTACETTVEVDIPQNTVQLTANALFNPDSMWKVELHQNRYVLDTTPFAPVPDATVKIKQQGRVVAELDYRGESIYYRNSFYTSSDSQPALGEDYTLEITHPTLGSVTANSRTTPVPTPILSFVWDTLDIREIPNAYGDVAYGVTIRLDDPPEENFYSLVIATRREFIVGRDIDNDGVLDPVLREFSSSEVGMRSDDPTVDNPSDDYVSELLFKDVNFNGQEYELKLYMQTTSTKNPTYPALFARDFYQLGEDEYVYDLDGEIVYKPGDSFPTDFMYALLRTVTEEYYQYNYTRDLQASVENNPFAQPVQVFDNIENGLGIFAGYSQTEQKVTIK